MILAVGAVFAAIALLLGPRIGTALQPPPLDFFDDPALAFVTRPEPTELARSLITIAAPIVIGACILALSGRSLPALAGRLASGAAVIVTALGLLVAGAAVLKREPDFGDADLATFSTGELAFAALVVIAVLLLADSPRVRSTLFRLDPATSQGGGGAILAALVVLVSALWLLPAIFTDQSIAASEPYVWRHLQVTFEDFAAVADGATPGVDYASQYSALLPYLLNPPLELIGFTHANFTVLATLLSLAALLAVYATLRIVTRSRLAAAALYVPILAVGLLPVLEAGDQRVINASVYQLLPLRYLAPFGIAWLLARRLAGYRAPHPAGLFFLAGLAVLNGPEFGAAAGDEDRPLTGMLAYAGIFGLGAGLYYAGRSLPENLVALYPAWGMAVALLAWAVLRELGSASGLRRAIGRIGLPGLTVLFAAALMVATLADFPAPGTQVRRITEASTAASPFDVSAGERFVREWAEPGDPVASIMTMGHYTARKADRRDVSFLNSAEHAVSPEQVDRVLDELSEHGGRTLFTTMPNLPVDRAVGLTTGGLFPLPRGLSQYLGTRGWRPVAGDSGAELTAWRQEGRSDHESQSARLRWCLIRYHSICYKDA